MTLPGRPARDMSGKATATSAIKPFAMISQPILAQSSNSDAFALAALGVGIAVGLAIMLAINAVICWLISNALKQIPEAHRKMEPGQVWLLMIPCFSIVWNFFVFQRVPDSFKSYFDSVGRTDVGDCGKSLGLWFSICVAVSMVPLLGYVAGIASLILLILCLVKFNELKNKIAA